MKVAVSPLTCCSCSYLTADVGTVVVMTCVSGSCLCDPSGSSGGGCSPQCDAYIREVEQRFNHSRRLDREFCVRKIEEYEVEVSFLVLTIQSHYATSVMNVALVIDRLYHIPNLFRRLFACL